MSASLPWSTLLGARRLTRDPGRASRGRSPFQQDADLIVFSAAFRRLQDKTQVHPLSARGRVRTRLTHSIEVASVGRSLGMGCGLDLAERGAVTRPEADAMSHIVFAACLAHDIGNPPFGHAGEDALSSWFREHPQVLAGLPRAQAADLCQFEGNAQGLRTLTQLENYRGSGGLRLTHATLAGFMKYTVGVGEVRADGPAHARKPGFFESERPYVRELREGLGLPGDMRHPLAFLTEAADDICYAIIDVEDGHAMGLVPHVEACELLQQLAGSGVDPTLSPHGQLQKLRGIAIGRLVEQVVAHFVAVEPELRAGRHSAPLLDGVPEGPDVAAAKALSARRIFDAPPVAELQKRGRAALHTLLEHSVGPERDGMRRWMRDSGFEPPDTDAPSEWLRSVVDWVASLTDEHALTLAEEAFAFSDRGADATSAAER